MHDTEDLRERWTYLYRDYLPALAKAKDPVQQQWVVNLDHCFARIILDNAIGLDRPWTEVVKQPAVKNMNKAQLEAAIALAEKLATGEADLVALNNESLAFRGKKRKATGGVEQSPAVKKHRSSATVSSYFLPSPQSPNQDDLPKESKSTKASSDEEPQARGEEPDMSTQLKRIESSDLTHFRKRMLTLLCEIPRGRYSTYKAMSDHVTKTSHRTCARAVGSAMRNNPFAPEVPCHRVLANNGSLGGFCGYWGENGKFASRKHELLYGEGVRFDSRGKVKGPPFREFTA